MNPRLLEAALRRERLIERIGHQRQQFAADSDALRRLCAVGDRAVAAGQQLRAHPEWLVGAFVALAVIRPRRAWRLVKAGFVAWRGWIAVRDRWNRLAGR